jgi:hypothetical protein
VGSEVQCACFDGQVQDQSKSLIFLSLPWLTTRQCILPDEANDVSQGAASTVTHTQQRGLEATVGWSGFGASAGITPSYSQSTEIVSQSFPSCQSSGLSTNNFRMTCSGGAGGSLKKQQTFALLLEVPQSVVDQKHDVVCSFAIEGQRTGMGFNPKAYVQPKLPSSVS